MKLILFSFLSLVPKSKKRIKYIFFFFSYGIFLWSFHVKKKLNKKKKKKFLLIPFFALCYGRKQPEKVSFLTEMYITPQESWRMYQLKYLKDKTKDFNCPKNSLNTNQFGLPDFKNIFYLFNSTLFNYLSSFLIMNDCYKFPLLFLMSLN